MKIDLRHFFVPLFIFGMWLLVNIIGYLYMVDTNVMDEIGMVFTLFGTPFVIMGQAMSYINGKPILITLPFKFTKGSPND